LIRSALATFIGAEAIFKVARQRQCLSGVGEKVWD